MHGWVKCVWCYCCRRLKQTINKVKLLEVAGGKKTTFDKLVAQMDKIAEKLITSEYKCFISNESWFI